jgi:hypothetical protein
VTKEKGSGPKAKSNAKSSLASPRETDFIFASDEDDDIGALAGHLQRRLSTVSRSNSLRSPTTSVHASNSKLGSLPGSKVSLVSDTLQVDIDTAVKIIQEVKKNASPEDIVALHKALQPSGPATSPSPTPGLGRKLSAAARSSQSLIRRRSLATPGLATRGSPADPSRRSWALFGTSLPPPQNQEWKVDMMGTSPLTKLAALDLAKDGRESPTPRAKTPGDMEYSHLGALKVGSLFVTNGAPSPAPSTIMQLATRDASQEEDYFTASEGCSSPVSWFPRRKARAHARSKSAVLPRPSLQKLTNRKPSPVTQEKRTSRCDSPLKNEAPFQYYAADDEEDAEPLRLRLQVVNKSADTLARDYQAEIASSPYATEDTSLEVQATANSKLTGTDDEGFADGALNDAVSFREEAFRILDGTIFSDIHSLYGESSHAPNTGISERHFRRPAPSKADSGYSSGGSLHAVERFEDAFKEGTASILPKNAARLADLKESGNGPSGDESTRRYTFKNMLTLPVSKPLPPVPTHESVTGKPSHLHSLEGSASEANRPVTPKSIFSQPSSQDKGSAQRKLQKRRPSSQNLPVVQSCQPIPEGSIPGVPSEVRAKFTRRLSETPGMECLTRTYLSTTHTDSSEALVDSPATVPVKLPTPSPSPAARPRHHRRAQTERPSTPPSHGLRHSFSFFRSKTSERKSEDCTRDEDEQPVSVLDFGTVASTLSQSPYDAAMSTLQIQAVTSPTRTLHSYQPHQLGNALPRAKSMVNMDARMASEFARARSKDRALVRPNMPQRPRSYHPDSNSDAREAMAFRSEPNSEYNDIPPVPAVAPKRLSQTPTPSPRAQEKSASSPAKGSPSVRVKPTGQGKVVSQLIDRYDKWNEQSGRAEEHDWDGPARLWNQRRKSIAEGLRDQARGSVGAGAKLSERAASQPPEDLVFERYSGGLDYNYEPGFGVGGSAGTRQARSCASRKSMHFSNRYGVDLSDVPVVVQRS